MSARDYLPPQRRPVSDRLNCGRLASHIAGAALMLTEGCALDATPADLDALASIARQVQADAEALSRALRQAARDARQAGAHIVKSPKV